MSDPKEPALHVLAEASKREEPVNLIRHIKEALEDRASKKIKKVLGVGQN